MSLYFEVFLNNLGLTFWLNVEDLSRFVCLLGCHNYHVHYQFKLSMHDACLMIICTFYSSYHHLLVWLCDWLVEWIQLFEAKTGIWRQYHLLWDDYCSHHFSYHHYTCQCKYPCYYACHWSPALTFVKNSVLLKTRWFH